MAVVKFEGTIGVWEKVRLSSSQPASKLRQISSPATDPGSLNEKTDPGFSYCVSSDCFLLKKIQHKTHTLACSCVVSSFVEFEVEL